MQTLAAGQVSQLLQQPLVASEGTPGVAAHQHRAQVQLDLAGGQAVAQRDEAAARCLAHGQGFVVPAQQRRLAAIDDPQWIEAMVSLLAKERWFRWFDSGDLQSADMLLKIFEVARQTPHCSHWVATRERSFVRQALLHSDVPANLVVRVSGTFPDLEVVPMHELDVQYGNVHQDLPAIGVECPAPKHNGRCDTCRACWSKQVKSVSYHIH